VRGRLSDAERFGSFAQIRRFDPQHPSIANERALEVVSESWYSTELQTIVMSKTTDPRLGETIYKLTDILRVEPLRSLFEVPGDYTIRVDPQAQ
jgi:hypothetical protein